MRLITRLLLFIVLLAIISLTGFRIAPVFWETARIEAALAQGRFIQTSLGPIYAIAAGL